MPVRIGVTSALRAGDTNPSDEVQRHVATIRRLGAEPVILRKDDRAERALGELELAGIVFSGGGDVSASHYGGHEALANDRIDLERDEFEMDLLRRTLAARLPTLCVCRGLEVANVALGGTLIEDLRHALGDDYRVSHHQVKERGLRPSDYVHPVSLVAGTDLHAIFGVDELEVNSLHHQAIKELALPLRVAARAADGVIEAIEFADSDHPFFFGVQWHPEALPPSDNVAGRLYSAFVRACQKKHY